MEPVVVAAVAIAATSPLIGRAAGYVVAKSRWVEPGRAKTVMPEFPTADAPANGGAARRFDVSVARATRALGRRLRDRPDDVWAEGVAAELSIPRDVATAALERLRSNAPCSLRVTQDGKLVHRFDREGIERALAVTSGTGLVARSLLFVASIVANIGAVWPVVASGLFAGLALLALSSESDTSLLTAIGVLVALPFLFAGVIGGGAVVGALLTPLLPSPKLGNALPKEEEKKEKAGVAAKAAEHRADARSKRQSKRAEKRRRKAEEKRRARDEAGSAGAAAPPLRASGTHWQSLVTSTDAFGLTGIAAVVLAAIAIAGIPILLVVGAAALFGFSIGTFLLWVCIILLVVLFIAILIETGDIEAAGIMTPLVIIGLLLAVVLFALVGAIAWLVGLYSSIAEERPRATAPGGWVQRRGAGDVFTLVPTTDHVERGQLAL
ncbi:MAG: hypothetical protein HOW73_06780, partial [Polyangiaceae bacterium]|nr:hypothetical protein [Polyangiaceae bacterium]